MHANLTQSCRILCNPVACQAPLPLGFSRQEYWSGFPYPPPGDLPNPGMEPTSPVSPASAGEFFTAEPPGKPIYICIYTPVRRLVVYMFSGKLHEVLNTALPQWAIFLMIISHKSLFLLSFLYKIKIINCNIF